MPVFNLLLIEKICIQNTRRSDEKYTIYFRLDKTINEKKMTIPVVQADIRWLHLRNLIKYKI